MKKAVLLSLFTFVLLAFSLAPVAAQQDVTLTLWTHDGLYVDFFTARAEEWKANYPDINFTFDFQVVSDVWTVVLANIAAGEPIPDLLGMEQAWFPRFMEGGLLEQKFLDLTDLIGDERSQFVEGRWSLYSFNGRIYGVDSGLSAAAYYYQPEIFEQNGVEVPTTWNEFLAAGQTLAANGVQMAPLMDDPNGVYGMLFLQRGGQVWDAEGNFVLTEEPNRTIAIEVLNYLKQGIDSGIWFLSVAGDFWTASPITGYQEGRVAGALMPDWYSDYVLQPQATDMAGQWAVAPMPVWDDGAGYETSVWGGTGFAIAKDNPNAQYAWELLHYAFMTQENQIKRFEEINYYPTMISALEDPRVTDRPVDYFGGQEIGEVFAEYADGIPVWYQSVFRAAYQDALTAELVRFFEGEITAEEVVDNVIATVEDEIAFSS